MEQAVGVLFSIVPIRISFQRTRRKNTESRGREQMGSSVRIHPCSQHRWPLDLCLYEMADRRTC